MGIARSTFRRQNRSDPQKTLVRSQKPVLDRGRSPQQEKALTTLPSSWRPRQAPSKGGFRLRQFGMHTSRRLAMKKKNTKSNVFIPFLYVLSAISSVPHFHSYTQNSRLSFGICLLH